ncbi:P-loop NTPase fold protein [Nocardia sp. NPDC055002]
MTASSGDPQRSSVGGEADSGSPRLRLRPLGKPLVGHADVLWRGTWGTVDGKSLLAVGRQDNSVQLWDAATGEPHGTPLGHADSVTWGAWGYLDDQPLFATGSTDGAVRLWDARTCQPHGRPMTGHVGPVEWGEWGRVADLMLLATGGRDGTVRLWDPVTGRQHGEALTGHTGTVVWGAWGVFDGQPTLATGGTDHLVQLWDPATGTPRIDFVGHSGTVQWGAWGSIDGRSVLATGDHVGTTGRTKPEDRSVWLWGSTSGPFGMWLEDQSGFARGTIWGAWSTVDGQSVLATGHFDGIVRIWEIAGDRVRRIRELDASIARWGAWCDAAGRALLATGGDDGTVRLFDPATGEWIEHITDHTGGLRWGAWGVVNGRPVLATGSSDNTICLSELFTEQVVQLLPPKPDSADTPDHLARADDATALADIITSRSTSLPMAIGVFGEWGEGKSHFLGLVRDRVAGATPDPSVHVNIRQIRFNAWHYAETDLWASLVAELFTQLTQADSPADTATAQRGMSRLEAELVARRGLNERIAAERGRLRELEKTRARIYSPMASLGLWIKAFAENNVADTQTEKDIDRIAGWREEGGRAGWLTFFGLLVLVGAGVAVTIWLSAWLRTVAQILTGGVGVLLLGSNWGRISAFLDRFDTELRALTDARRAEEDKLDTAIAVSKANIAELRQDKQNLTAAGQLAGFVADRAGSGDYRSNLGIMTRIREDFEHMAELLRRNAERGAPLEAESPQTEVDELPQIDRIVLYIDDLDRCPPDRVVQLLEAIHLLLAVRLFVVVVAVDPRWLLRSISVHYREMLTADHGNQTLFTAIEVDPDDGHASTPAQYLEKIFQLVYTLPPLDRVGYTSLIDEVVGARADSVPSERTTTLSDTTAPSSQPNTTAPRAYTPTPALAPPSNSATRAPVFNPAPVALPRPELHRRIAPFALTQDELHLIRLLGPPLITTARSVKRLANSYSLLSAIERQKGNASTEQDRLPAMVLLAALVGLPELGPVLLTHLYRTAPETMWADFLTGLRPEQNGPEPDDGWRNKADARLTVHEVESWHILADALQQITTAAAALGIVLPAAISEWQHWIQPVGRLSFPAGRVVAELGRTRKSRRESSLPIDESPLSNTA